MEHPPQIQEWNFASGIKGKCLHAGGVRRAYVQVSPVAHPNLDREMQVDKHLASLGVKLSKAEALQRYQRTEAETDDDALEPVAGGAPAEGPLKSSEVERLKGSRLFNSSTVQPFDSREAALAALRNAADTPSAEETDLARALQSDLRPVAERLRDLLQEEGGFAAACKRLRGELPDLLREIGQEESAFAKTLEGILAAGGTAEEKAAKDAKDAEGEGKLEGLEGLENLEELEAVALANEQARGKTTEKSNSGSFAPEGDGERKLTPKEREKERKKQKSEAAAKELAKRIDPDRFEKARKAKGRDLTENEAIECFKQQNEENGNLNFSKVQSGGDCPKFMETRNLGDIGFYQNYNGGGYQHISQKMTPDGSQLDPGRQAMLKDGRIAKTLAHGTYYRDIYKGKDAVAVVGSNDNGIVILGHRSDGGLYVITAYVDTDGKRIDTIKRNGLQKGFRLENEKTGNGFPSPELEDVCPGLC